MLFKLDGIVKIFEAGQYYIMVKEKKSSIFRALLQQLGYANYPA